MRRVWATVVSVWAVLAIVAVLAWSRPGRSAARRRPRRPSSSSRARTGSSSSSSSRPRARRPARHDPDLAAAGDDRPAASSATFRAMGTTCAVARDCPCRAQARPRRGARRRRAEVAACERALSRFDPRSDLSRLNARLRRVGRGRRPARSTRSRRAARPGGDRRPVRPDRSSRRSSPPATTAPSTSSRAAGAPAAGWRAGAEIELDPTPAARASSAAPPSISAASARASRPTRALAVMRGAGPG